MKKVGIIVLTTWVLASMNVPVLASTSALASALNQPYAPIPLDSTDECVIPRVDDERVPFPLANANTKFELADGETYLLNGTLVVTGGVVYLKVDFDSQPWLATAKMIAFPYFVVSSVSMFSARQYAGQIVQVAVVAQKQGGGTSHTADLKLTSILPPILMNAH